MQYGIPRSLIDFAVFYTMKASILGTVVGIAHRDEDFLGILIVYIHIFKIQNYKNYHDNKTKN